jgi:hypothetical protein
VPYDKWSWALLLLSLALLTLVSKGQWLDVFGAFCVRQSMGCLNRNRTLISFLFAAIVITCGYESIISSYVIVPPPLIVARNLKDLVDAGYGIFGFDSERADNATYLWILRREKISHSSLNEPPFISNTLDDLILGGEWYFWSTCNATGIAPSSFDIDFYQDKLDGFYPLSGIMCHFAKETKYPRPSLLTYSGYFATTFHTLLTSFVESGILNMLHKFGAYADQLEGRIRVGKRKYAQERTEIPFELKDPKIVSIFVAWGILLVTTILIFLLESLMNLFFSLYVILRTIKSF